MRLQTLPVFSAALVGAVFLFGGCGSSGDSNDPTTTGTPGNGVAGTTSGGSGGTTVVGNGGSAPNGGTLGNAGTNVGTAGTAPVGGTGGTQGVGGEANPGGTGGTAQGGTDPGGAAGQSVGGSGGTVAVGEECEGNPPIAPIADLITAQPDAYQHDVGGHPFAVDLRVPIIMGKLVVDMGVSSGGIFDFARDRGMHTYGGEIQPQCTLTYDDGPPHLHNGDCRLNRVDGIDYNGENADTPESSLFGNLKAGLQNLAVNAPGEGWDYFLDANGELRLQDIGFTGYSHGAQTAARIGQAYCIWRAVSRSGPRDNECGNGTPAGDWESGNIFGGAAAYKDPCDRYSQWIMEPPASPMSHFFSFAGKGDGQFGDDQWTCDHLGGGFIGPPVNISTTDPGDSHRFYADDGHGGFDNFTEHPEYLIAQQKAWSVPQENMDFAGN
jgi:hypothetical protein